MGLSLLLYRCLDVYDRYIDTFSFSFWINNLFIFSILFLIEINDLFFFLRFLWKIRHIILIFFKNLKLYIFYNLQEFVFYIFFSIFRF